MRPVFAFLFALVLASAQAALLRYVGGGAASLALPLPIVVYLSLHAGNMDGAVGAAGVGYVLDLVTGVPKGLMTFLAVALFLFGRLAAGAFSVQGRTGFAVLSGLGTFLYGLAVLVLTRAVSPPESAPSFALLGRVLVEAVLTGALAPLVMMAMRQFDAFFVREEPGLLR